MYHQAQNPKKTYLIIRPAPNVGDRLNELKVSLKKGSIIGVAQVGTIQQTLVSIP